MQKIVKAHLLDPYSISSIKNISASWKVIRKKFDLAGISRLN